MPVSRRLLTAAVAATSLTLPASAVADGWSSGVPVTPANASSASLTAGPDGLLTAVWLRGGRVEAADRGAFGTFPEPELLSGEGASAPAIAANAAGREVAVWLRDGTVEAAIRPSADDAFGPAQAVSSVGVGQQPRVGVEADGDVTVAWVRGGLVEIVRRTPAQGTWPAAQQIVEAQPNNVALGVGPGGGATAVWVAAGGPGWNLRTAARSPGATAFGAASTVAGVEDVAGFPPEPAVAVDGSDAATAVWADHTTAQYRHALVRSARRTATGAFGPAADIGGYEVNQNADEPHPQIAVNAAGDALATWTGQNGSADEFLVSGARRAGAGAFDAAAGISTPGADRFGTAAGAMDPQGRGAAVWSQGGLIQASRLTAAFAAPSTLSAPGAEKPAVAFDGRGNAVAVWQRDGRIESAAYDVVAPSVAAVAVPATARGGDEVRFTATGSDGESPVTVRWSFGDGATATGGDAAHRYAIAGTYTVTATVTDGGGNTSAATRTIEVAGSPVGGPGDQQPGGDDRPGERPGERPPVVTATKLTALRVTPGRLRSGRRGRATFRLTAPAKVTFTVERRKGARFKRVGRAFTAAGKAGANRVTLPALRAGRYRLVAAVPDTAPVRRAFRVVKR